MSPQEAHQVLQDLGLSARFSKAATGKLASLFEDRGLVTGAVIFEEGSNHPWVYLVAEGEVALEMCVPARGCTRILTVGPGEWLAWSALVGGGKMTATAVTLRATRLLAASATQVRALCEGDEGFGYELMCEIARALAKRLVATRLQLLDLYDVSGGRQATGSVELP
jgi:CRP-like cAMP-binding protein